VLPDRDQTRGISAPAHRVRPIGPLVTPYEKLARRYAFPFREFTNSLGQIIPRQLWKSVQSDHKSTFIKRLFFTGAVIHLE